MPCPYHIGRGQKMTVEIRYRRLVRLKDYDCAQAGAYFLTIYMWNWDCLFGEIINGAMALNEIWTIVAEYWEQILSHFKNVELDEFVVMPNHMHGIMGTSINSVIGCGC